MYTVSYWSAIRWRSSWSAKISWSDVNSKFWIKETVPDLLNNIFIITVDPQFLSRNFWPLPPSFGTEDTIREHSLKGQEKNFASRRPHLRY